MRTSKSEKEKEDLSKGGKTNPYQLKTLHANKNIYMRFGRNRKRGKIKRSRYIQLCESWRELLRQPKPRSWEEKNEILGKVTAYAWTAEKERNARERKKQGPSRERGYSIWMLLEYKGGGSYGPQHGQIIVR
jgi:hypothetical protein